MRKSKTTNSTANFPAQQIYPQPSQPKQQQKGYKSIALQEKYGITPKPQKPSITAKFDYKQSPLTHQMWQICAMDSVNKRSQMFQNYFFTPKTNVKAKAKPLKITVNTAKINTMEPIYQSFSENLVIASIDDSDSLLLDEYL